MNNYIKEFIETHIEDIELNNFTKVYELIDAFQTSSLTQVLISAKIDPLQYLSEVPAKFLFEPEILVTSINIPSNIKEIGPKAFVDCDFSEVRIPEGVQVIRQRAFSCCRNLTTVYLPSTIRYLDNSIFARSRQLKKIFYEGTLDQFEKIIKASNWISAPRNIEVELICTDTTTLTS